MQAPQLQPKSNAPLSYREKKEKKEREKQEALQKQLSKLLNDKPSKKRAPNSDGEGSDEDDDGFGGLGGGNDLFNKKKKSYAIPKVTLTFKEDARAKA